MAVLLVVVLLALMHGHVRHAVALVVTLVLAAYYVAGGLVRVAKAGVRHDRSHVA